MVCKRSLYCWKNGPCASDQTRKQIWEDNIRFRKNLREVNQSDHYWSFQISKTRCLCLEGEDGLYQRPLSRKYRSASLQRLHDIDCASITHDYNGLKFRNCFVHCPNQESHENLEIKRPGTPIPLSWTKNENSLVKYPFKNLKSNSNKNEFCHRYKNTLLSSKLTPSMETKYLSQSNLCTLNKKLDKKVLHTSYEDLQQAKTGIPKTVTKKEVNKTATKTIDFYVETDLLKPKKLKELKPVMKLPKQELSPLSRTTRKMFDNKSIPFATYGCNNNNLDIGCKTTHNVLASKLEVYPNALSAKQHKRESIRKQIQNNKEIQNQCLPEAFQKRVNHSSLWSLDTIKKETKSHQKKHNKYLLPVMSKPLKKFSVSSTQLDSKNSRTYCKPQIYFY